MRDMAFYDEKFLMDLIKLDGRNCRRFCIDLLNEEIELKSTYEHQVYMTLIVLKYFKENREKL